MLRVIGDRHGKDKEYREVINVNHPTIQVGDFGVGFGDIPPMDKKDRFIRGNHDNPEKCKEHPNWIPDGHFENDMFFIGGARSTDIHMRTKDVDWWEDEELSNLDLYDIGGKYIDVKPSYMFTHDAPIEAQAYLLGYFDHRHTRTQQTLQALFVEHQPKIWFFGHYHKSFDYTINGTRFICLNELEYIDIDII